MVCTITDRKSRSVGTTCGVARVGGWGAAFYHSSLGFGDCGVYGIYGMYGMYGMYSMYGMYGRRRREEPVGGHHMCGTVLSFSTTAVWFIHSTPIKMPPRRDGISEELT